MGRVAAPDDDLAPYCCRSLGTALLLAAIVGSGIMGERLAGGTVAMALLANAVATGAILTTLIFTFGPISGAHFNPAVTLADAWQCGIAWRLVPLYIAVQVAGAFLGVIAAHVMFSEAVIQTSQHVRAGGPQLFSEIGCDVRPVVCDLGLRAAARKRRGSRSAFISPRLLVHSIDVIRESGCHPRAGFYRYVRGNSSARCAGFVAAG